MKISNDLYAAFEFVLEMADEQLNIIRYEVENRVQGTMYNCNDILDAEQAIKTVTDYLQKDLF